MSYARTAEDAHQTAVAVNEAALAEMDDQERHPAVMRTIIAALRLADDDPQAATVALAPVIAGSVPAGHPIWVVEALLLEAIARYMLGDAAAAQCPIERVPDLAEPTACSSPHIASELSISPKIASVHVSVIRAKLGVSTAPKPLPPSTGCTSSTASDLSGVSHLLAPVGRANGARIRLSSNVAACALAISCGYRHSPVKEQPR